MRPAHVVEIITPKKLVLSGLWFGPKKPKRAIVWVHGLTSSAFARLALIDKLIDGRTSVLTFNNRGHDSVSRLTHLSGKKLYAGGAAFERFEDCADDIQGAVNFAKQTGAHDIYIAGHSTGCQKTAYWAYKNGSGVKGIILLAPGSDYAGAIMKYGMPKLLRVAAYSRALIKSGKEDDLLPRSIWSGEPDSPRRFLSLYTPDSIEQSIFAYFDPNKRSKILSSIRIPIIAIFGEKDEHIDRPAKQILSWIEMHTQAPFVSLIAKGAKHTFKGYEKPVAKAIKQWISAQK